MSRGDLVDEDLRVCAFHRPVWSWWDWAEHVPWNDPVLRRYYCIECGLKEPMIIWVINEWDDHPIGEFAYGGCDGLHQPGRCPVGDSHGGWG